MLFSNYQKFSDNEIKFIQGLEKLIGKNEETCRKIIQKKGFIFLDKWSKKMGFVKEEANQYLILSLYFEKSKCHFYQVIIKGSEEKWQDSRIFDSDLVREKGIVAT